MKNLKNLKNWNILFAAATLIAGAMLSTQIEAQTMFRCGNKYQDRPCDGGQQGKAMGSTGTSRPAGAGASAAAATDAECTQRGIAAQTVMWAREGGTTIEKQLSDIDSKNISPMRKAEERKLVVDVYQKRGTAPQVRAAIEADCLAYKEQQADADALTAAAARAQAKLRQPAAPAGGSSNDTGNATAQTQTQTQTQRTADDSAARKKSLCDRLNAEAASIRSQSRSGGSPAYMDSLNSQRQASDSKLSAAGC